MRFHSSFQSVARIALTNIQTDIRYINTDIAQVMFDKKDCNWFKEILLLWYFKVRPETFVWTEPPKTPSRMWVRNLQENYLSCQDSKPTWIYNQSYQPCSQIVSWWSSLKSLDRELLSRTWKYRGFIWYHSHYLHLNDYFCHSCHSCHELTFLVSTYKLTV